MTSARHCAADAHCPHAPLIDLHHDGVVRAVNQAADRLLQDNAEVLSVQGARLVSGSAAALQRCLQRAHGGQHAGLSLRRVGRLPLTLRAAPQPAGAVQIMLRDPEAERPDAGLLQDLFALTPTEALVAGGLALGQRTADIAAGLGIQTNTVQAHLKSIYGKTGCRHQAALLSLVLRSAAMQATPSPGHPGAGSTA